MKKIFILLLGIFACHHFSFAQYGDLGIKARFDQVYTQLFGPLYDANQAVTASTNLASNQGVNTWNNTNPLQYYQSYNDQETLGTQRSGSLEAILRMYEVTCDDRYLYEFMQEATIITNFRSDKVGQSNWKYLFINSPYFHGRILLSFTHFVHLVKSNTALTGKIIPVVHRPNFANKTTFGEYADWLNVNNMELMNELLSRFWRGNDECMCKPSNITVNDNDCRNGTGSDAISDLNFQAPYGAALIYLHLVNPNQPSSNPAFTYGGRAVQMARAYLVSHGGAVLGYNATNNAYTWYHNGWQKLSNGTLRTDFTEDIGHGAWDIMFPLLYNKYYSAFYPSLTSGQYFENYQMVRFRNTFTKIIYNSHVQSTCSNLQATFDCNVFGGCSTNYPPNVYSGYQMNAKNWTGLYVYDNVAGAQSGLSVYDIMMNYYINVESCLVPINNDNYGGVGIIGLADLAVANYKKENIYCILSGSQPRSATFGASELTLSPNPSTGIFQINSEIAVVNVRVFDGAGRKLIDLDNTTEIDASALSNGTYFVAIKLEDETTYSIKWTKQ